MNTPYEELMNIGDCIVHDWLETHLKLTKKGEERRLKWKAQKSRQKPEEQTQIQTYDTDVNVLDFLNIQFDGMSNQVEIKPIFDWPENYDASVPPPQLHKDNDLENQVQEDGYVLSTLKEEDITESYKVSYDFENII